MYRIALALAVASVLVSAYGHGMVGLFLVIAAAACGVAGMIDEGRDAGRARDARRRRSL